LLIPLALVRGMARAAQSAGAVLHERTPVAAIERNGASWRVVTDKGAVTAGAVFLATGAYSTDLWPGLRESVIPMRAYQVVSKPLSENVRATVLPGGHSVTDTRRLYSGVRILSDGRMHVSADGPAFARGGEVFRDKAARRIRDLFPQISELDWEESWSGWVDMSTDQYPHLHELAPGLWGAIGLSGRGIVWGTLIGREVARRLMDIERDKLFMPVVKLRRAGIRPFAAPLIGALMKYYRALDRAEMAGYVRPRAPVGE
jgi:glycine/D-amino acid oxidase-like deaminating enzyme